MLKFQQWLENEAEIKEIEIPSLIMTRSELFEAVSNIARGYPAATEGPIEVAYLPRVKKYQLVNGYHRMVDFLLEGRSTALAKITGQADWNLPNKNDRFVYMSKMRYKGLEEFVEPYLLKRL